MSAASVTNRTIANADEGELEAESFLDAYTPADMEEDAVVERQFQRQLQAFAGNPEVLAAVQRDYEHWKRLDCRADLIVRQGAGATALQFQRIKRLQTKAATPVRAAA